MGWQETSAHCGQPGTGWERHCLQTPQTSWQEKNVAGFIIVIKTFSQKQFNTCNFYSYLKLATCWKDRIPCTGDGVREWLELMKRQKCIFCSAAREFGSFTFPYSSLMILFIPKVDPLIRVLFGIFFYKHRKGQSCLEFQLVYILPLYHESFWSYPMNLSSNISIILAPLVTSSP